MRYLTLATLTAAVALTTACSSVLSIEPIATASDTYVDPALAGTWASKKDAAEIFVITRGEDATYNVRFKDSLYTARLFRAGDAQYLDVSPKDDAPLHAPGHAIVRIWLEGDDLRSVFLDSKWFQQRLVERGMATVKSGEVTLITSPAAQLREALAAFGQDDRAYDPGEISTFRRLR